MEYIKRDDALHSVCVGCNKEFEEKPCEPSFCDIRQEIQNVPTADVAEVKHGYWFEVDSDVGWSIDGCSICGEQHCFYEGENKANYCPHCGAKMDGKEDA